MPVRVVAESAETYEGRPLVEVLESLRAQGLEIVYSSRLVRPEMRVLEEPSSAAPREILNEILPPHGLVAEDRSRGRVVIVRNPDEPEPEPVTTSPFSSFRFEETVEVVAAAETERVETTSIHLLPRDIESVAGSGDNIFRVLHTLPGVAATSELSSRVAVRGGAPEQNLILVDGVEVYNPYRLFGFTSAFNPETVDRFELSSGSLEPRHGDRLSSALVVENRLGSDDELFQGAVGASLVDANVVFEGRLPGASGSWLLAARRTYYDLVTDPITGADFPSFSDVHTKISWAPRPGQRLSFTGLVGSESTGLDSDTLADDTDETLEIHGRGRTRLFALNFESSWGSKAWSRSTISYHRFHDAIAFEGFVANDALASRSRDETLSEVVFSRGVEIEDVAWRQELGFELDQRHHLGAGFELHRLDTRWRYDLGGRRSTAEANASGLSFDTLFLPGASVPAQLDSAVDYSRFGIWLQDAFRTSSKTLLTPSLRLDHSGVHGKTYLSPRLDAAVELGGNTRVRASTGVYHQSPGYEKLFQSDYFVDLSDKATRRGLESERATGLAAGIDWAPGAGVNVSFDGYHRWFADVLVGRLETDGERVERIARYDFPPPLAGHIPTEPLITTHPVNSASGRAWGFDVAASKRSTSPSGRFSGWATYSFARSDRSTYSRRFPFDYDRAHAGSLVGRFRLTRSMELSLTGRAHSGIPRTPAIGTRVAAEEDRLDRDGDGNVTELVPVRDGLGALVYTQDFGDVSNINTARWPSFARLDARFTYRSGGGEGGWLFYFELLNVLNRDNTLVVSPTIHFEAGRAVIREERISSFPVLPNFGFRYRF